MTMYPNEKRLSSMEAWNLLDESSSNNVRVNQQMILIHAMDLIFTMIGCIVLNIDHRPNLRRFEKTLSLDCMNTIRRDLENLLHFENKLVNAFLVAWIKTKYSNNLVYSNRSSSVEGVSRKLLKKNDLRLAIMRVMKSMIFRTRTKNRGFLRRQDATPAASDGTTERPIRKKYYDRSIIDYPFLIEHPRKLRILALAESRNRRGIVGGDTISLINNRRSGNCEYNEGDIGKSIARRNSAKARNRSSRVSTTSATKNFTNNHVCKKFHCPLCYGWLWLPVCYAIYIFASIIANVLRRFIESILVFYGLLDRA